MNCAEIATQAAGLASLPEADPDRRAAFEHARSCPACVAHLAKGTALMRVLGEAAPLPAPQPEALRRASREILAEMEKDGARPGVWGRWVVPALALVSVLASMLTGGRGLLSVATGLKCVAIEVGLGLVPLGLAYFLTRRQPDRSALSLAAFAGTGALVGQAWLHTACHAPRSHPHLLLFHTGGVLLALALGALTPRLAASSGPHQ